MNSVDSSKVAVSILNISLELGKLEGVAEGKGYDELSHALQISCQDIETEQLEKELIELKGMKKSLSKVYKDITNAQANCLSISNTELKEVFDKQIKHLHEQRVNVKAKLRNLYELIHAHLRIREVFSEIESLQQKVNKQGLTVSDILKYDTKKENLAEKVRSIFKEKMPCQSHFDTVHKYNRSDALDQLQLIGRKLKRMNGDMGKNVSGTIESLLGALEKLSTNLTAVQSKMDVRVHFAALPQDLQIKFLEISGILPENYSFCASNVSETTIENEKFDEETLVLESLTGSSARAARRLEAEKNRSQVYRAERELKELIGDIDFTEFPSKLLEEPEKAIRALIKALNDFPDYCETNDKDSLSKSTSRKILKCITKFDDTDSSPVNNHNGSPALNFKQNRRRSRAQSKTLALSPTKLRQNGSTTNGTSLSILKIEEKASTIIPTASPSITVVEKPLIEKVIPVQALSLPPVIQQSSVTSLITNNSVTNVEEKGSVSRVKERMENIEKTKNTAPVLVVPSPLVIQQPIASPVVANNSVVNVEQIGSMSNSKEVVEKIETTKITVKFNTGLKSALFIRGEGGGLSWNQGAPLKNINQDTWEYETSGDFQNFKFKICLNDKYEKGSDHIIKRGEQQVIEPKF